MTYIVALTGGIGSGKTTIANAFADLGVPLVDADIISRQVVQPGTEALNTIAMYFGPTVLHSDGTLNRTVLRQKIFTDIEHKNWLNNILHPLIHEETQRQLSKGDDAYFLWVVPLLIENNIAHLANRVLVVDAYPEEQIQRTIKRDNISRSQVENILAAQASREERLSRANDIITNHDSETNIAAKVFNLHQLYLTLANSAQQEKIE